MTAMLRLTEVFMDRHRSTSPMAMPNYDDPEVLAKLRRDLALRRLQPPRRFANPWKRRGLAWPRELLAIVYLMIAGPFLVMLSGLMPERWAHGMLIVYLAALVAWFASLVYRG
jgi:hypothetical protein